MVTQSIHVCALLLLHCTYILPMQVNSSIHTIYMYCIKIPCHRKVEKCHCIARSLQLLFADNLYSKSTAHNIRQSRRRRLNALFLQLRKRTRNRAYRKRAQTNLFPTTPRRPAVVTEEKAVGTARRGRPGPRTTWWTLAGRRTWLRSRRSS